ncbi:hypothetical protein Ga0080559_TMP5130 (plasmid) [Salipiger profundus]|uniref:Uncharacterized protein n=1 Tax=Salipiger profundus TaxID=1229727 RepID=A0A1U7DDU5_9RHOB|nr:hypothetical protein Ga0080559_TMP5130 [Salipiger profundus]
MSFPDLRAIRAREDRYNRWRRKFERVPVTGGEEHTEQCPRPARHCPRSGNGGPALLPMERAPWPVKYGRKVAKHPCSPWNGHSG